MGIRNFFRKSVVIARLKSVIGSQRGFTTTATVSCALQELDRRTKIELDLDSLRAWQLYCDIDEDIREGDRLIDADGTVYKIQELTKKDYGINQHLDIILIEYED